LEDDLNR